MRTSEKWSICCSMATSAIASGQRDSCAGRKTPNAGKTEHLRFTAIWMKQDESWQEVARHANIVPPQWINTPPPEVNNIP